MKFSKVHVQYKDGSKPKGMKVVLGFSGLLSGGMTKPAFTDNNGTALVKHESTGRAEVYVSGKKAGSFNAPGETAVFI